MSSIHNIYTIQSGPAQPSPPRVSLQVFVLIENKTKSRVTNDSHYISFVSVCQVDCGLASAWCSDWTPVLLLSLSPPDLSLVLVLMEREIKIKLKIKQISIFPKFRYFFTLNALIFKIQFKMVVAWAGLSTLLVVVTGDTLHVRSKRTEITAGVTMECRSRSPTETGLLSQLAALTVTTQDWTLSCEDMN